MRIHLGNPFALVALSSHFHSGLLFSLKDGFLHVRVPLDQLVTDNHTPEEVTEFQATATLLVASTMFHFLISVTGTFNSIFYKER
jgi:hypothetical protein